MPAPPTRAESCPATCHMMTDPQPGPIAALYSTHRRFRGIELKGVKIYDLQKVTFSTLFKLYIAGLGVLIPKRYHM